MLKPREDCRLINGTLNKLERDWRKNKNLLTLYWQALVMGGDALLCETMKAFRDAYNFASEHVWLTHDLNAQSPE